MRRHPRRSGGPLNKGVRGMESMNATAPGDVPKIRILVADDHPVVRGGLIRFIERQSNLSCCGEAGTAAEVQAGIAALRPDLVILDLRLHDTDGMELIKSLVCQF